MDWVRTKVTRDGDTAEDVDAKARAATAGVAVVLVVVVMRAVAPQPLLLDSYAMGAGLALLGGLSITLMPILTDLTVPQQTCRCCLLLFPALLVLDWGDAAGMRSRSAGAAVILLDISLVGRAPPSTAMVLLGLTILWWCLTGAEYWHRFGLFAARPSGIDHAANVCDCADPPCATSFANALYMVELPMLTLLLDFHFTHGFAKKMREQLAMVKASVSVSQRVATQLCRYDVDEASAVVKSEGHALPPELELSFTTLLQNLRAYRPYLPQSVLVEQEEESGAEPPEPTESDAARTSRSPEDASESRTQASGSRSFIFSNSTSLVVALVPKVKAVTVVCLNHVGFLTALTRETVPAWQAADIASFSDSVLQQDGVVGSVDGDHRFASFNAVRYCPRHVHRALLAVFSARLCADDGGRTTAAVVSGSGLCGDFGSSLLQSFMVIGPISSLLMVIDRLAGRWGGQVLLNGRAQQDAATHWRCGLRGAIVYAKLGSVKPERVYEGLGERAAVNEEWMYVLESVAAEPLDAQNRTVEQWLATDLDVPAPPLVEFDPEACARLCSIRELGLHEVPRGVRSPPLHLPEADDLQTDLGESWDGSVLTAR
eukprot:TRINITY_DN4022_c2_g1_i1.p1 TRINITY_DN4022_c2_g1~~TRINITY_DN4022_c2_g1_i1.p1  ORF type:complete len:601 (+),score=186.03 TRINITY_DN4022_c2_g1_i1:82-1884(+)